MTGSDVQLTGVDSAQLRNRKIDMIGDLLGPLPDAPGRPPKALDKPPPGKTLDDLGSVLFPEAKGGATESMVVGGLTVADIVYHAAAIEPEVLKAADFSRWEDLSGVFEFGSSLIGSEISAVPRSLEQRTIYGATWRNRSSPRDSRSKAIRLNFQTMRTTPVSTSSSMARRVKSNA